MKITKRQLSYLIRESFGSEFNKGYDQSVAYFGKGIIKLSQTTDIDSMQKNHQIGWIEKNCDMSHVGTGTFRNAFVLNNAPEYIVKIAYLINANDEHPSTSGMGRSYNKREIETFNKYPEIFPRVYEYDKRQYCWFIVEKVDVIDIHNSSDFGKIIINTFSCYERFANFLRSLNSEIKDEHILEYITRDFINHLVSRPPEYVNYEYVGDMKVDGDLFVYGLNNLFYNMSNPKDWEIKDWKTAYDTLKIIQNNSELADTVKKIFDEDQKIKKFFNLVETLDLNDLWKNGNLGTNKNKDEIIVLDHSFDFS